MMRVTKGMYNWRIRAKNFQNEWPDFFSLMILQILQDPPPCYSTPSCYTRSLLYVSPPEPLIIRSLLFSPSLVAATATALNFPCAMVVATYGVECAAQVFFH